MIVLVVNGFLGSCVEEKLQFLFNNQKNDNFFFRTPMSCKNHKIYTSKMVDGTYFSCSLHFFEAPSAIFDALQQRHGFGDCSIFTSSG